MTLHTIQDGRAWLRRAARRASRQRLARLVLWAMVGALGTSWAVSLAVGAGHTALAAGGVVGGSAAAAILFGLRQRWQVSATDMADHLDQRYPHLENSTRLLLVDEPTLTERLQQRRVLDRLRQIDRLNTPKRPLAVAGTAAVLVALLCGGWWVWGPNLTSTMGQGSSLAVPMQPDVSEGGSGLPEMAQARLTVTPPPYTGRPARRVDSLSTTVLEGSRVQWSITGDASVAGARLILGSTDTLRLSRSGQAFEGATTVSTTRLYAIELVAGDGATSHSDYYALRVKPDVPPTLTRLAPDPRTTVSRENGLTVNLEYAMDDDLGLAGIRAVGTVARGSGESVKFREEAIPLDRIKRTSATDWTVQTTLDAEALGMEMGDELYLYLEATDTQQPQPNRTRSETIFIVWPDTARGAATFAGSVALPSMPEYFRSQRQIIIDTEKLLAQRGQMSDQAARQEANRIGVDQKVLRLRYGKFLGEEMDSGITGGGPGGHDSHSGEHHAEEGEGGPDHGEHADGEHADGEHADGEHADGEHADGEHADGESREGERQAEDVAARYLDDESHDHVSSGGTGASIPEGYAHIHDTAEQATFYSADVKRELKAVLAQMWEAELRLRTNRPQEALPYEYRALRMLKALQHKARVYVKRIGFEPPPLKPEEQRLTGDLDDVESLATQATEETDPTMPSVRSALRLLQQPMPDTLSQQEIDTLTEAANELADIVRERNGQYIEGLGALRVLIDEAKAGRVTCTSCVQRAVQTFWAVLPEAEASSVPRARAQAPLHRQYIDALNR